MLKYFYIILLDSAARFVFLPFLFFFFFSLQAPDIPSFSPSIFLFITQPKREIYRQPSEPIPFFREIVTSSFRHTTKERGPPSANQRTFYSYLFFVSSLDGFDCKLVCFWLKMEFLLLALSMGLIVDLISFC
jgi:hypothetical protein